MAVQNCHLENRYLLKFLLFSQTGEFLEQGLDSEEGMVAFSCLYI